MTNYLRYIVIVLTFGLLGACEQVESLYTQAPARFNVTNVNTIPALASAVGNLGMFCTIEEDVSQYVFTGLSGSNRINKEQVGIYKGFIMGFGSGFIVGLPNFSLPGENVQRVVCYDIVCRNCMQEHSTYPKLRLRDFGKAYCNACQRTYDLNNQGYVIEGTPGDRLYFYRVTYTPYVLTIAN